MKEDLGVCNIWQKIKEADSTTITLETIESKLSIDLSKEQLKDFLLKKFLK